MLVRRSRYAGMGDDTPPTYDPGITGAQNAATVASMKAAADGGSKYAQDWMAANATDQYEHAVETGTVPAYITAPADQQKFADLMTKMNTTGFFSLSPDEQAQFNFLRTTGSSVSDENSKTIGGAETGVYAWDPATGTGDVPPGEDKVSVAARAAAVAATPKAPVERAINLLNGVYVYADDHSVVPQSELTRLGLKITNTPSPAPSPDQSFAAANDQHSMTPNPVPSMTNGGGMAPMGPTNVPEVVSDTPSVSMLAIGGLAIAALLFVGLKKKGR